MHRTGGRHPHFHNGDPAVVSGLQNPRGIERGARLGENSNTPVEQTDFGFRNAIQALKGLFGPIGSKRADHPVDLHARAFDSSKEGKYCREPDHTHQKSRDHSPEKLPIHFCLLVEYSSL